MAKYVTFGEVMLRLTPPGFEVLLQTPQLVATFGGAEANVAVSLANYGEDVAYVTAAPKNAVGDALIKELRSFNVCTKHIRRSGDRFGVYFTETGAAVEFVVGTSTPTQFSSEPICGEPASMRSPVVASTGPP